MRFKSCAVWFDDAIPMRCQLNNAPLIEARFPVHRTLLWSTSVFQARSPWTETGGNQFLRDPDYTVDAKEPPIRAP